MEFSKSKIDKAGKVLSAEMSEYTEEFLILEQLFDDYRKSHLHPLSEMTLELQRWLSGYGGKYYIAQRLKRKPQILRKLRRLSVRLSQLQDVGGCRIIVDMNKDVDNLVDFILGKIKSSDGMTFVRKTDYRVKGRDDSGYRAVHLILLRNGRHLELQIRSKVQHYWAESIERTSVIYGYHLKEQEGDARVISYFKKLSDIFYEIEAGREPASLEKLELDRFRVEAERIIEDSDRNNIIASFVNEDIVKTLAEKESRNQGGLNNWIIVFDWNVGNFIYWDVVSRVPDEAVAAYVSYEKQFPASGNYEVVMIGSSDVATVRQTHSHYFGIDKYDNILETLDESVIGFSKRMDIDVGARQILAVLYRKKFVGNKSISVATLKNHYCQNVITFDSSLGILKDKGLVNFENSQSPVSINPKRMNDVIAYI